MKKILIIATLLITAFATAQTQTLPGKLTVKGGITAPYINYVSYTTTERNALSFGANHRVYIYNSTDEEWQYWDGDSWETHATGGGASTLTDLTDVSGATATNRFVLVANGSTFVSRALTEADISDLTHTVDTDTQLTDEQVQDKVGAMLTGNTETLITATYQDADGTIDFVVDNDLANYSNATSNFSTGAHTVDTTLDIASSTEVNTGTNDTKAISPLALANSTLASNVATNNAKVTFPGFTSLLADYSFTDNSTNWNTAFGWGNHSGLYVGLTGAETVNGIKTFGSFPVTPSSAPTSDYQVANKKYVDDEITAAGGYNDEAAQDAIGTIITDTSEIDFTYNDGTPSITASIVTGSIDVLKLDSGVQTSLGLADSALQSEVDGSTTNEIQVFDVAQLNGNNLELSLSSDSEATKVIDLSSLDTNTQLTQEQIEDFVGAMVSGNTETLIAITYNDTTGKLNFVVDNDLSNYDNSTSNFSTGAHTVDTTLDIASSTEVNTGTNDTKAISPLALANSTLASNVATNNAKVTFPGFTSLLADYSFTDNSTNWNTAFGWGNHASQGYLTSEVDGSTSNELQTLDVSQLSGSNLELSLSSDGEATKVIDLSSLDTDTNLAIATTGEINTGTVDNKAISPLGFAGSDYASDITANNAKVGLTDSIQTKKWVIFGDSFSNSLTTDYPKFVIDKLELTGTVTHAVPSDKIADQNTDLDALLSSDVNYFDDFDIVSVLIGINDYLNNTPLGTIDDSPGTATVAGGLKYFVETILSATPEITMYILTPPEADSVGAPYKTANTQGYSVEEMAVLISRIAAYYGVQCIDLYSLSQFNESTIPTYTSDNLHPNALGNEIIGDIVAYSFLSRNNIGNQPSSDYHASSVGIKTPSPDADLHVQGGDTGYTWSPSNWTTAIFENNAASRSDITIAALSTGQSILNFADEDSQNIGRIRYDHINEDLSFWVGGLERFTIGSSGDFGIKIGDPDADLHVQAGNTNYTWSANAATSAIFENGQGNDNVVSITALSGGQSEIWFGDEDAQNAGRLQYDHTTNSLNFWANFGNKASIDASGNLTTTGNVTTTGVKTASGTGNKLFLDDGTLTTINNISGASSLSNLNANHYAKRVLNNGATFESLDQLFYDLNNVTTESLQFTPNAVQADTLYAIQTSDYENGYDADFIYARTGTATRTNVNGLIESVAEDVPRVDYSVNPSGELLLEPSRTNLQVYSDELDNAAWGKTNISVTADAEISVYGNKTADKITSTTTGTNTYIFDAKTLSISTDYTISVFAKRGTATKMRIDVWDTTNATNGRVQVDLSDGSVSNVIGTSSVKELKNGWYHISVSFTTPASLGATYFRLHNYENINGSYFYAHGMMIEPGSYQTSYIPTTTASATRNAETASGAGSTATINSEEGVLYLEAAALFDDVTDRHISLSDGTTDEQVTIGYDAFSNRIEASYWSGGLEEAKLSYVVTDITDLHKMAFEFSQDSFELWVDGSKVSSTLSGDVSAADTFNELQLADGDGGNDFIGRLRELKVFTTALTDAELTALTSKTDYTPKHLARTDVDPYFTKDVTVQGDLNIEGTITQAPKYANQGGATYTLTTANHLYTLFFSSGSAKTVTIPTNATEAIPIGTVIYLINTGAGDLTFNTTGIVLTDDLPNQTIVQNARRTLTKVGDNGWLLSY